MTRVNAGTGRVNYQSEEGSPAVVQKATEKRTLPYCPAMSGTCEGHGRDMRGAWEGFMIGL